jgi:ankyrin repeat protein
MIARNKPPIIKKNRNRNMMRFAVTLTFLMPLTFGLLFYDYGQKKLKDQDVNPSKGSQAANSQTNYLPLNEESSVRGESSNLGSRSNLDTALLEASVYGDRERVSLLLDQQADINTVDEQGATPLILATTYKHKEIVDLLLKKEANVNVSNKVGNSALIEAAAIGHDEIVRSLLAGGADVQIKNIAGQTALDTAQQYGHKKVVKMLTGQTPVGQKQSLFNPNVVTANPKYLHQAALQGDVERVSALLSSGVEVNARDAHGRTALIIATKKGDIQIVRILLRSGADPNAKDSLGETAMSNAQRLGLVHIGLLLKQAGAKTPSYNQIVTDPK